MKNNFGTEKTMGGITLTKEECYCGFEQFFEMVALKIGLIKPKDLDYVIFDCSRIRVTKATAYQLFRYYKDNGASDDSIIAEWKIYGPKVNLPGSGFTAIIQSRFIKK